MSEKNPWANHVHEKDYILNSSTCTCKSCKYLESIIDGSVIKYYEIIEVTKPNPTKAIPKNYLKKGNL